MSEPIITPNIDRPFGCPLYDPAKCLVVKQGQTAQVDWIMRKDNGQPIDLTGIVPEASGESSDNPDDDRGHVMFRCVEAVGEQPPIYETDGYCPEPSQGRVSFDLIPEITQLSQLWKFDIAVINAAGNPQIINSGLLSVERSLFGDISDLRGPPTFEELRSAIRDFAGMNLQTQELEFSNAEILHALRRPLQEYNETLPRIPPNYNSHTFPHREAYLKAAVGYLLRSAADHFRRNKFIGSAAGVTDQPFNKDEEYMQSSELLLSAWRDFVKQNKYSANLRRARGSFRSGYYG